MSELGSKDPGSFFISPVQQTRYNSLQAQCQLSILELRIFGDFEFRFIVDMIGGGGVEHESGIGFWSCWF